MMNSSIRSHKSQVISIESFPSNVQGVLSEVFDKDGNGDIDTQELVEAANLYLHTKSTNSLLRKGATFVAGLSVCLVGVLAGLTYGIVDANKDTLIEGRALMTKQEEPVSVSTNEMKLPLAALPFLPFDVASKVIDVSFPSEGCDKQYHTKVTSIVIVPDVSFEIETTAGHYLTWDIDEQVTNVTLKDGSSWLKGDICSEEGCPNCVATNVFSSSEVLQGFKNFEEATEETRRNLAGCALNAHKKVLAT